MQYSFSYFYYLMNRHKLLPLDAEKIWYDDLDTDHDGRLDENEMITLAAMAYGKDPTYEYLVDITVRIGVVVVVVVVLVIIVVILGGGGIYPVDVTVGVRVVILVVTTIIGKKEGQIIIIVIVVQ